MRVKAERFRRGGLEPPATARAIPPLLRRQVGELRLVKRRDRCVERRQEREPRRGDAGGDHAPVAGVPAARHPTPLFHPVEQPRHIGRFGHQALGDLAAGEPGGAGAAQDAQDVVLRPAEPRRAKELPEFGAELPREPLQRQVELVLEARERFGLFDGVADVCAKRPHLPHIVV